MLGRLLHSYEYSRTKERLASKLAGVILRITAKTRDNLAAKLLGRLWRFDYLRTLLEPRVLWTLGRS